MTTSYKLTEPQLQHKALNSRRIMLFDMSCGGHHGAFIQHLIRYWGEHDLPGYMDIVVMPQFIKQHQDVVDLAATYRSDRLRFVPITTEEEAELAPCSTFARRKMRALREWSLMSRYAKKLGTTECLLMYFDTFQLSVVLGRKLPCTFSGIYFRPRFHYGDFQAITLSQKERIRHLQERVHISLALRHPQFKTLFSLDQFSVKLLNQSSSNTQVVYLPDPVQTYPDSKFQANSLKANLGIEPGRLVFLMFGIIDERKGIHQILDAIAMLPPHLCQKLCLLLVGCISSADKPKVKAQIIKLSQLQSVQVITRDRFVMEREIQSYFRISDVVLTTHQRHVGTSNTLIRAAAAQKPVLCSDYGLMGEWTRHYKLGLSVNSTVVSEIAQGLTRFLQELPEKFFDSISARKFARQHSAEKYAETIFSYM
ncbi:glycosyltransferase [Fischerella sp. JS2]|uniref:glycosyltransferase n=1 Tax=Fischerella sp. JS2 TaxID=2597771 RepID=UPI0028E49EF7|nr:glycosyltransferase [Fischerella sp. JS2]